MPRATRSVLAKGGNRQSRVIAQQGQQLAISVVHDVLRAKLVQSVAKTPKMTVILLDNRRLLISFLAIFWLAGPATLVRFGWHRGESWLTTSASRASTNS